MKALIIGAGIGGLGAAIALAQKGIEVEVLEQAAHLGEVGAGIQISPNGMRALRALGVEEALEPVLFEPPTIEMRLGVSGREIFSLPMKGYAERRWGARFIQIHRADLHDVLRTRLEALCGDVIRLDAPVTGYALERGGVCAQLSHGAAVFGDVLIGADGVRSAIRTQLCGPDRPRFTGNVAWRITTPIAHLDAERLPDGGCIWVGAGKHAVTTRIRAGTVANFVGIVEQEGWEDEGWTIPGTKSQALADFGAWDPVLRQMIEGAGQLHRWALHDRAPFKTWCDGPVTVLGDAAHPMLPSMAQGAVAALEDAVVLARLHVPGREATPWLAEYAKARQARTAQIQARSRSNADLFHKQGFVAQALAWGPAFVAGRIAPGLIHQKQDWIYRYDPSVA